ncbi:MAG TPA: hypothetical protein VLY21_01420 [Nitrososphaerales archaeon]|nr:hypothetical protein [Nitrososphaerales archaeon]
MITRLTSGSDRASSLLEHLRDPPADEEPAGSVERAMRRTRSARLMPADLSRGR